MKKSERLKFKMSTCPLERQVYVNNGDNCNWTQSHFPSACQEGVRLTQNRDVRGKKRKSEVGGEGMGGLEMRGTKHKTKKINKKKKKNPERIAKICTCKHHTSTESNHEENTGFTLVLL